MLVTLQYVRAVAALLVVYFHAVLQVRTAWPRPDTLLPQFGEAGVDLFFVLSGFVMWRSTAGRPTSLAEFWRRRLVRIVPLYWSVTLAAASIAFLAPQLLRSTRFQWEHLAASLLFVPWPNPAFPPGASEWLTPVVIPGWTLNFEMLFYIVFGVALLANRRHRFWTLCLLISGTLVAGSVLGRLVVQARFYADPLLLEFLAGVAIAAFIHIRLPGRQWAFAATIAVLLGVLCVVDWASLDISRALRFGVPAALVVAVAVTAERSGSVPLSRWWLDTGDASYSIYLTHVFVISGLRMAFNLAGVTMTDGGELLFVSAAVILSAVVGRFVYVGYERPVTRAIGQFAARPGREARTASHIG